MECKQQIPERFDNTLFERELLTTIGHNDNVGTVE